MADLNASAYVDGRLKAYAGFSDAIWEHPELNFEEHKSAAAHSAMIASEGFRPITSIAGLRTAVGGEFGSEGPVIAILGEYDALPGLSQVAHIAEPRPVNPGGHGHGCGHNLLGAASLLAASAVKDWLVATGRPGRVRYIGCPAEEGGSGKGFMVRAGVFDDVDIAICWHPGPLTGVTKPLSLACVESDFTFTGRASHASVSPHLGRSALDAVELMNVGVNYLREHMPPGSRVHYAITDSGGLAPNVVQAHAVVRHLVRALTLNDMWQLYERVNDIACGAALMTGTAMSVRQRSGEANLVGNTVLEACMQTVLQEIGSPPFSAEDQVYAAAIQATLDPSDVANACANFGYSWRSGQALCEGTYPLGGGSPSAVGSTDVGTVSWVVPTVQCRMATCAIGTPAHSWQMVAQGKSPAAHKGMAHAAKAMSAVASRLLSNPDMIAAAKAELKRFRELNPFRNPMGDDVAAPDEQHG